MDTALSRLLLAVLLLCSLAFDGAFASDGYYHPRSREARRHRKAKGYYAHKPQPKPYFATPAAPPPYSLVPAPVSSPPPPPPPAYEELAPSASPSSPPPSYELPSPPPSYVASPSKAAYVQGLVLCQNCLYVGTSYSSYGKPLSGAVVKLSCESSDISLLEAKSQTDDNGHFIIQVPNFDYEKYSVVEICKVYLVSSSKPTCSTLTNINFGIDGSPLRIQNASTTDKTLYFSAPLVFAPNYCRPTPPPSMSNSPPQHW